MTSKIKYDHSLFETKTNKQLANLYGVTKQAIVFQRNRYRPDTDSAQIAYIQATNIIDDKILNYIKENTNCINVAEFKRLNKLSRTGKHKKATKRIQIITRERFLKIAKNNGIEIKFIMMRYKENEHGMHCYGKCECDIGKFAIAIRSKYSKFVNKKYKNISYFVLNHMANKYISTYKKIKLTENSMLLTEFYVKIFNDINECIENGIPKNSENEISENNLNNEQINIRSLIF